MVECKRSIVLAACAAAALSVATGASAAVSAPYSNDFSTAVTGVYGTGTQGGESTSTWAVTDGTYRNTLSAPVSAQTYAYASWQTLNLGGSPATASDFVMSSDVTLLSEGFVNGNSSSQVTAGFGALGDFATFGRYGGSKYYLANIQMKSNSATPTGRMVIQEYITSSSGVTLATGEFVGSIEFDKVYKMSLIGVYTDGQLSLTFSFDDPTDSNPATTLMVSPETSSSTTLTTGVSAGRYFGYRDQISNGMTATLSYDNFVLDNVIPEPATAALAGLASLGALIRRRRA